MRCFGRHYLLYAYGIVSCVSGTISDIGKPHIIIKLVVMQIMILAHATCLYRRSSWCTPRLNEFQTGLLSPACSLVSSQGSM